MRQKFIHASAIAAVASVSLAGQTLAATYQSTTVVSVPYSPGANAFGTAPGMTTTYTSLNLTSLSRATRPKGGFTSMIVGTVSGKNTDATAALVNTAYAYDLVNGFRLIGDYTFTSQGGHYGTAVTGVNGVGQVIGTSPIDSTSSQDQIGPLGQEAWLYSTANNSNISIGLTGANFQYQRTVPVNGTVTPVAFTGTFSSATPNSVNDAGQVAGTNLRFAGDASGSGTANTQIGQSAFLYTPGSGSSEIGLFDSGHSYNVKTGSTLSRYSNNMVNGLTSQTSLPGTGTYITGTATAYYDPGNGSDGTALGNDGWVSSNGATATGIGFYLRGIDPVISNAAGNTFKYYIPKASTGSTPATSQTRSTAVTAVNASGQVIGTSAYYNTAGSIGTDAFVYSAKTAQYRQIGFTANGFTSTSPAAGSTSYVSTTGARSSTANYINATGNIVGTSTQYFYYTSGSSTFSNSGTVAYFDDGTGANASPTRIGLYGQAADPYPSRHINPQSFTFNSTVTNLTDSGFVGGYSSRYYSGGGLGQDAWVVDPSGNINLIDPTDAATSNYTSSTISYLSEDGVAVGLYAVTANQSPNGSYNQAFLWSVATGFVDLGTSLSPSLTTTGYQNLINSFFSTTGGSTLYATASTTASSNINAIFTLTAVPEPASLAALAMIGIGLGRRRTRRA